MQLVAQTLLRRPPFFAAARDRLLHAHAERVIPAEVVGQEEVEDAPHVRDGVLHGRTGEDELLETVQTLRALRVARGAVLDVLRLVEHDHAEGPVEVGVLEVALQERVGGDHEVRLGDAREGFRAVGSRYDKPLQPRRELLRLGVPVLDERRGTHHERGLAARLRVDAFKRNPRERLKRLAEAHFVREQPRQPALFKEAHPVDALLLVGTQHPLELPEVHGLELRVFVLRARGGKLAPRRRGGVLEVHLLEACERAAHVGRVHAREAEVSRTRRRARLGAVGEHAAHFLDGANVEEVRALGRHQVGVAPVDRALDFGLRDLPRTRLEGIAHLERAAGRVRHVHHRHDARQPVERGREPFGIRDLPTHPPHARLAAAKEVQHVARFGDEPTVGVGRLEAEFREYRKGCLLRLQVAHVVEEHVVGIGSADGVRPRRRAAADFLFAVAREELGGDGRARAGELHVDHGRVRHKAEEILARRHLHLDLLAQYGQVVPDERRHRLARNHLVVPINALERSLQHVRKRHEHGRALALLRERRGPHETR